MGKICGLKIPDLNPQISNFCNLTSHYLYAKLIEIRAEDLAPRFLTADSILEVYQYNFDMDNLPVTPKHFRLTINEKYSRVLEGLLQLL